MTIRALPVHPYPLTDAQLDALKQAKAQLDAELGLDYKIQPVRAAIGVPLTILAFEELPPFLCDVALIKPGWGVENVKNALKAVLSGDNDRLFGPLGYLRAILGEGVQELEPEDMEQKVRFQ